MYKRDDGAYHTRYIMQGSFISSYTCSLSFSRGRVVAQVALLSSGDTNNTYINILEDAVKKGNVSALPVDPTSFVRIDEGVYTLL